MVKPGFVLGNGSSRLSISLDDIKTHGRVYGCNALYRDFAPDVLVATDPGIAQEIEHSGYALKNEFYTRQPNINLGSKLIPDHYGFSSGPVAVKIAAQRAHEVIYLIGFDLQGKAGKQNNIYSGTLNYKATADKETFYGNWVNQLAQIFREHPRQKFVRLVPRDGIVPVQWLSCENHITQWVDDFMPNINNKPWQRSKELVTNIK